MRTLAIIGLVLAGCSSRPSPAPMLAQNTVVTHPAARVEMPTLSPTLAPEPDLQPALDAMEEQISGQTMFCVDSAPHDCPSGFRCDDGACVANP